MQLRTLGLHGVCSELAAMLRVFRAGMLGSRCRWFYREEMLGGWALARGIVGRVVELECVCRKGSCLDVVWCVLLGARGSGPDAV